MDALISDSYRQQNALLHREKKWGGSAYKQFDNFFPFIVRMKAQTVLDYGCGKRSIRKTFMKKHIPVLLREYDPAVSILAKLPREADVVLCIDVLEHIEPEHLDAVLAHVFALTRRGAYLVIATRPASAILPDGRNAHLIVENADWWLDKLSKYTWKVDHHEEQLRSDGTPHELRVWLVR